MNTQNSFSAFFEKIKKTKAMAFILIALAIGVLLLMIPDGDSGSKENANFVYEDADKYTERIEEKTRSLICEIDGVSSCKVMINLESGYQYHFAADQRITEGDTNRDVQKDYVIIDVDGNEQPVVVEKKMPKVLGVAVVCPNISAETEYKILCLVSSLFDVPSNKITITR
ncbi:MAG: hypothetical protein RR246_04970 [Clostridia bacterium]